MIRICFVMRSAPRKWGGTRASWSTGSSSGRAPPITRGKQRGGPCTESERRDGGCLGQRPHARRGGGADACRRRDARPAARVERRARAGSSRARPREARAVRVDRGAEHRHLRVARGGTRRRARAATRHRRRGGRDRPHYRTFVEYAGATARRQGVQGLHVHVGMPDAETCLRVLEWFIPWLPLMLALSANSPWFEGARTGLLSTRAEVLGLLPRHGAPPRFDSWSDWERLVRRFCDSGVVDTYTAIHWDVRPHPKFGTLEVRMPDQPTDVTRTGAFVALVHALAAWALAQPPVSAAAGDRAVFDQNRWAASRFGPRAKLIHAERDGEAVSATELYAELVQRIGADPLDASACEADRQLAFDDPREATADIVRRSLP